MMQSELYLQPEELVHSRAARWLTIVILAIQEVEIERTIVHGQTGLKKT
jgi:hypothetical protein